VGGALAGRKIFFGIFPGCLPWAGTLHAAGVRDQLARKPTGKVSKLPRRAGDCSPYRIGRPERRGGARLLASRGSWWGKGNGSAGASPHRIGVRSSYLPAMQRAFRGEGQKLVRRARSDPPSPSYGGAGLPSPSYGKAGAPYLASRSRVPNQGAPVRFVGGQPRKRSGCRVARSTQ